MRRQQPSLALLVVVTLVALLGAPATMAVAASAETRLTYGEPSSDAPEPDQVTVPDTPVDLGVVSFPLRVEAGARTPIELADGRSLLDTVEVRLGPDGQQILVNELGLDDYVAGVAEMPGRWPIEALKAQAVAARTYAWHSIELGTFEGRGLGYDICDTVDCQVFRGAEQEAGDAGARWRQAVDETAGEVLVDDAGAPILARYFSTSGGRTLPNEVVFPSSGPRPYLVGIDDPADEASPYHRWQVTFSREEFEAILSRGERLAATLPVEAVERLGDLDDPNAQVRVIGADGTEVDLDAVDLRRFVSEVAPEQFPDRFPTARADGLRPLPSTLPSARFEVTVGDDEVVVDGRGWGHAVGLGQYGARGRAEAGEAYDDILAAYYNGLGPTVVEDAPQRVRVGLSRVEVGSFRPLGPATVRADGEVVAEAAVGTWAVALDGDGVRLTAPPGTGDEPELSATVPVDPDRDDAVRVRAVSATPGVARLEVTDADGEVVVDRSLGAVDAGEVVGTWDLTDADGEQVGSGDHTVTLHLAVADEPAIGHGLAVRVERPSGLAALTGGSGGGAMLPVILVVLAAGIVLVLMGRRRGQTDDRRTRRSAARGR